MRIFRISSGLNYGPYFPVVHRSPPTGQVIRNSVFQRALLRTEFSGCAALLTVLTCTVHGPGILERTRKEYAGDGPRNPGSRRDPPAMLAFQSRGWHWLEQDEHDEKGGAWAARAAVAKEGRS